MSHGLNEKDIWLYSNLKNGQICAIKKLFAKITGIVLVFCNEECFDSYDKHIPNKLKLIQIFCRQHPWLSWNLVEHSQTSNPSLWKGPLCNFYISSIWTFEMLRLNWSMVKENANVVLPDSDSNLTKINSFEIDRNWMEVSDVIVKKSQPWMLR